MSTQQDNLTAIADAIRAKDGILGVIVATDFAQRILDIPTGPEPEFTGHVDRVGLAALGYNETEIDWFQQYVCWDEENDADYIITAENLATVGMSIAELQDVKHECLYVPKSIFRTNLITDDYALAYSPKLVALYIPDNTILRFGGWFSAYNNSLYAVRMPVSTNKVTMGWFTFEGCTRLKHIEFQDNSLRKMTAGSFFWTAIEYLHLPEGIEEFGDFVIGGMQFLKTIEFPSVFPYIDRSLGDRIGPCDIIFGPDTTVPLSDLISDSYIRKLIIQKTTDTSIGGYNNLIALEVLELPEGITQIELNSFQNASSLKKFKMPSTVTSIDFDCFTNVYSLEELDLSSLTRVPEAGSQCFTNFNPRLVVKVPNALLPQFQSTWPWDMLAGQMVGV